MRTKILFIALISIMFYSCEKQEEITVLLKTSGTLKVKLINNNAQPLADKKIKLYDKNSIFEIIEYKFTDEKGIIDFGTLNQGTYLLKIDTIRLNNLLYNVEKSVQVISGQNKVLEINIEDFTATVNLNLQNTLSNNSAIEGMNVLFISEYNYNTKLTIDEMISKADFSGKTDKNGNISINNMPSKVYYYTIVYSDDKANFKNLDGFSLLQDYTMNLTEEINPNLLY